MIRLEKRNYPQFLILFHIIVLFCLGGCGENMESADKLGGSYEEPEDLAAADAAEGDIASSGTEAETISEEAVVESMDIDVSEDLSDIEDSDLDKGNNIQSGTLTAGDIDDNLNFDAFQTYLNSMLQTDTDQNFPSFTINDRVTLRIVDDNGEGVNNANIVIYPEDESTPIVETYAGSDGVFRFFPSLDGGGTSTVFNIQVYPPDDESISTSTTLDLEELNENRSIDIVLQGASTAPPESLDLMIVIDTTGSMADELRYLTTEFKSIINTIKEEYADVDMTFSLIAYRDKGDNYIVRDFDFTSSLEDMQDHLSAQKASGGGDYPEAMDQAMAKAVQAQWRDGNSSRILFLVADAPPHDGKFQPTFEAAKTAREMGVHIYPLAASGVADKAEFIMRSMAAITHGRYLFLTDDSGVGYSHAEPKIPCYVVTRLDQLIVRVISSELSGSRIEPEEGQVIRTVGAYDAGVCIEGLE